MKTTAEKIAAAALKWSAAEAANAICPQTAAAFVRAYMEARATALVERAA